MNKRIPKIFLTYAREDRIAAEDLYNSLKAEGFKPWMDVRNLLPGQRWEDSIKDAIKQSDFILVLLSKHSIAKRGYIQREIRSTLDLASELPSNEIFIIPVLIEPVELPTRLAHLHNHNIFNKGGFQRLLKTLSFEKRDAESQGSLHTLPDQHVPSLKPKGHVFVAMPFSFDMEDVYYYGILRAVDTNNFECHRIDKSPFTGDILKQIKEKISTALALIADLTDANPNVYLELGYAWGMKVPTILVAREGTKLCFDVRGQRCLSYRTIRQLEEELTKELSDLRNTRQI